MGKIAVWGERKVNIGDYEGRAFGISYTRDQVNNTEAVATINDGRSMEIGPDDDPDEVIDAMYEAVKSHLDKKEDLIRIATCSFVEGEFDSLEKLNDKSIKPPKNNNKGKGANLRNKSFTDDLVTDEAVEPSTSRTRKRR